jgi:transposase
LAAHLHSAVGRPGFRVPDHRLDDRTRPSARQRRKRGAHNQAIGRSRGGLTTKIHLAVRGLGCPIRFVLTAGHKGDAPQAGALLDGAPADIVIADAAYDADHIRQAISAKRAEAVIPNNPSRALKHPLDRHLYAQRHLVECCFSKLKQFRRVATRYEKTAQNYSAIITIAAILLWLR